MTSETLQTDSLRVKWRRETEYIIAFTSLLFSVVILALHVSGGGGGASNPGYLKEAASYLFLASCVGRLIYVHYVRPPVIYGWVSAGVDVLFLTVMIYALSLQYGDSAATLHAPGYVSYFILIALHAVRFDARLVIATGVLSAVCWASMLLLFLFSGVAATNTYASYFSSTDLWLSGEIAKVLSLGAFAAVLALAVRRAGALLGDAAAKEVAEVKMQEAEKTAQLKTEFLANMSHEIRTPMNGVLGMAQVLRESDLKPDQAEFVDTIQRSGDALLTIINDILDFSKIEAGRLRLDKAEFDLRQACEDVATLLGVTARAKGLELVVSVDGDVPTSLVGDAGRLRQILTNLIGNAIKFTEKGHVLVNVKGLSVGHTAKLTFKIEDTGIGIAAEKVDGIFSEFAQADGSTTRRFGGTGLGLSISQSLVNLMGGRIRVESVEGEGSIFSFNIELPMNRRTKARTQRPAALDLSRTRVLIVDDLEVNRGILKVQLQQLGALPDVAASAREAVSKIVSAHNAGQPYAIVVSDYQMPEIDGMDFVGALRKRPKFDAIQVIVLSSIDSRQIRKSFEELSVASYMTKPCRMNDLEDAVYQAVALHRAKLLQEMTEKFGSEDGDGTAPDEHITASDAAASS